MAKKRGFDPFILMTNGGGEVIGPATGQGGLSITVPVSYDAWIGSDLYQDIVGDGQKDMNDYIMWWQSCNFTYEQWKACGNTDEQWASCFGDVPAPVSDD